MPRAAAVLHVRGDNVDSQEHAESVGDDKPLTALHLLARVQPLMPAGTVSAVRTDYESIPPPLGSTLRPSATRTWPRSHPTGPDLSNSSPDTPSERTSRAPFQRQDIARNAHAAHNAHAQNRRSVHLYHRLKDRDTLHMVIGKLSRGTMPGEHAGQIGFPRRQTGSRCTRASNERHGHGPLFGGLPPRLHTEVPMLSIVMAENPNRSQR